MKVDLSMITQQCMTACINSRVDLELCIPLPERRKSHILATLWLNRRQKFVFYLWLDGSGSPLKMMRAESHVAVEATLSEKNSQWFLDTSQA